MVNAPTATNIKRLKQTGQPIFTDVSNWIARLDRCWSDIAMACQYREATPKIWPEDN